MKRALILLVALTLGAAGSGLAQDAATEERLNKLSGQIDDLIAGQKAQQRQTADLAKEVDRLREQMSRPTGNYASQDDLKRVADALKVVDQKRMDDAEKVHSELLALRKVLEQPVRSSRKPAGGGGEAAEATKPPREEKGFPYTIQEGDTLSIIVRAYKEKNIKVTTEQILKANPGLHADRLKVGQQIWIPAPTS